MNEQSNLEEVNQQDGGVFGFSGVHEDTFRGAIKRTKNSETNLIKTFDVMEDATQKYDNAYKTHMTNLQNLDDHASFSGMKNLFRKVIMKENFKQGHVDKSLPILFRNYRIEEETTPSAFRREHIQRQVEYVIKTNFAGREHDLIKNMWVEVGKHYFLLHITTIENIKKNRKIEHVGYVIDFNKTRSFLKEVLTTTKKNLQRRSRLVEIGNESLSESRRSSKSSKSSKSGKSDKSSKKTKKTDLESLASKKSSKKVKSKTKRKHRSNENKSYNNKINHNLKIDMNEDNSSIYLENSSKESVKDLSVKLPNKISKEKTKKKSSKPSIYLRTSEKQAKNAVNTLPAVPLVPQPIEITPNFTLPVTGTLEQKKDAIMQSPTFTLAPGVTPEAGLLQPPNSQARCDERFDAANCQASQNCEWNPNSARCFRKKTQLAPKPSPFAGFGTFGTFGTQAQTQTANSPAAADPFAI
jgi:hypothetical protein